MSKCIFLFSTSPVSTSWSSLPWWNSFWTDFLSNLILLSDLPLAKILNIPSKLYPIHFLRVKLDIFWTTHFLRHLLLLKLFPPRKNADIAFYRHQIFASEPSSELHPKCGKTFSSTGSNNSRGTRGGAYHGVLPREYLAWMSCKMIFVKFHVLAQKV